jgi:hypothetical protein
MQLFLNVNVIPQLRHSVQWISKLLGIELQLCSSYSYRNTDSSEALWYNCELMTRMDKQKK